MGNTEKLLQKIFENQEKLIGIEWAESRKKAFSSVIEMKNRQKSLTQDQVKKEAFEQAKKIRSQRQIKGNF